MPTHARETLIHIKWDEAKYLDLWSFVHLFFGMILGIVIPLFGFGFGISLSIALALMIAWELCESALGIGEYVANKFTDLLVGLIGYFVVLNWIPVDKQLVAFVVLLLVIAALDWAGFQAYKKRVRRA